MCGVPGQFPEFRPRGHEKADLREGGVRHWNCFPGGERRDIRDPQSAERDKGEFILESDGHPSDWGLGGDAHLAQISNLILTCKPSRIIRHVYLYGLESGEDALAAHVL